MLFVLLLNFSHTGNREVLWDCRASHRPPMLPCYVMGEAKLHELESAAVWAAARDAILKKVLAPRNAAVFVTVFNVPLIVRMTRP